MIRRVRIQHLSDYGRVLDIRTDSTTIHTPTRGMMNTEFNRFKDLAEYLPRGLWNLDALPNPLHEVVLDYGNTELDRLSRSNGYFKTQKERIIRNTRANSKRLTYVFFQLKNGTRSLSERDIEALVDLQVSSGRLDMISVPDPNPSSPNLNSLEKALEIAQKRIGKESEDVGRILPYLDLSTDYAFLRERLKYLSTIYPMIGMRYRGMYPSRYAVKDEISRKNVWIHLSGTRKHHSQRMRIIPTIHLMPMDFFDSFCTPKKGGFPPRVKPTSEVFAEPKPRTVDPLSRELRAAAQSVVSFDEKQYFFDPNPLGYYTLSQHKSNLGGNIGCDCFLCQGKTIEEFFDEYYHHNGAISIGKLKSHLVVHELISSFREFEKSQKEIEQTSYRNYLLTKPAITENLDYLPGLNTIPLDEFPEFSV